MDVRGQHGAIRSNFLMAVNRLLIAYQTFGKS